jgi:hypothetical protein
MVVGGDMRLAPLNIMTLYGDLDRSVASSAGEDCKTINSAFENVGFLYKMA